MRTAQQVIYRAITEACAPGTSSYPTSTNTITVRVTEALVEAGFLSATTICRTPTDANAGGEAPCEVYLPEGLALVGACSICPNTSAPSESTDPS